MVNRIIHIGDGKLSEYSGGYSDFELQRAEQLASSSPCMRSSSGRWPTCNPYVDRFRYKASKARQAQSRPKAMERMEDPARPRRLRVQLRVSRALGPADAPYRHGEPQRRLRRQGDSGRSLNLVPGSRIGLLGATAPASPPYQDAGGQQSAAVRQTGGERRGQHRLLRPAPARDPAPERLPARSPGCASPRTRPSRSFTNYLGSFGFPRRQGARQGGPFSGGEGAPVLALITWQSPTCCCWMNRPTTWIWRCATPLTMALQGFPEGPWWWSPRRAPAAPPPTTSTWSKTVAGSHGVSTTTTVARGAGGRTPADGQHRLHANSAVARRIRSASGQFRQTTRPLRQKLELQAAMLEKLQRQTHETSSSSQRQPSTGRRQGKLSSCSVPGPPREAENVELEWMKASPRSWKPWSKPSLRDTQRMEGTRVRAHEAHSPPDPWAWEHFTGPGRPAQSGLAPCPGRWGQRQPGAAAAPPGSAPHPGRPHGLQPALVQTEAVLRSPGAPCASRPRPGWPTTSTRPCWPHELELERLQQGVPAADPAPSPCFAAAATTCRTIYRYWEPSRPLRDLIC